MSARGLVPRGQGLEALGLSSGSAVRQLPGPAPSPAFLPRRGTQARLPQRAAVKTATWDGKVLTEEALSSIMAATSSAPWSKYWEDYKARLT